MGFLSKIFGNKDDDKPVYTDRGGPLPQRGESSPKGHTLNDNRGQTWTVTQSNQRGKYVLSPVGKHNGGGYVNIVVNNSIVEARAESIVFNEEGRPVSWSERDYGSSCIGE